MTFSTSTRIRFAIVALAAGACGPGATGGAGFASGSGGRAGTGSGGTDGGAACGPQPSGICAKHSCDDVGDYPWCQDGVWTCPPDTYLTGWCCTEPAPGSNCRCSASGSWFCFDAGTSTGTGGATGGATGGDGTGGATGGNGTGGAGAYACAGSLPALDAGAAGNGAVVSDTCVVGQTVCEIVVLAGGRGSEGHCRQQTNCRGEETCACLWPAEYLGCTCDDSTGRVIVTCQQS